VQLIVSTAPNARLEQKVDVGGEATTEVIMLPAIDSPPAAVTIFFYQKPKAIIDAQNAFSEKLTGIVDVTVGSPVRLYGDRSTDSTPSPTFIYEWKIESGPTLADVFNPGKSNPPDPTTGDGPSPTFTPTQSGTYKISLKVKPEIDPQYSNYLSWGDPDTIELNAHAVPSVVVARHSTQATCKERFISKVRVLVGDEPFDYTWTTVTKPAGVPPTLQQISVTNEDGTTLLLMPTECSIFCTEPGDYVFNCMVQASGIPSTPLAMATEVLPGAIITGPAGDYFLRTGGPEDVHTNPFSAVSSAAGTYPKTYVWSIPVNPSDAASIASGGTEDIVNIEIDSSALTDGSHAFEIKVIVTANGKSGEITFNHSVLVQSP
jgi:hypothetical protein